LFPTEFVIVLTRDRCSLLQHFTHRFPVARNAVSMIVGLARAFGFSIDSHLPGGAEKGLLDMRLLRHKAPPFTYASPPEDHSPEEDIQSPDQLSDSEWLNATSRGLETWASPLLTSVTATAREQNSACPEFHDPFQKSFHPKTQQYREIMSQVGMDRDGENSQRAGDTSNTALADFSFPWESSFSMIDDSLMALVAGSGGASTWSKC
jgi:hypothetical protein